jgi:hypothetical protein
MTLLWQVSLAFEVALLVVFALVVAATLLTSRRGGATISAYPHHPFPRSRTRDRHAA